MSYQPKNNPALPQYVIGIDPDIKKSGVVRVNTLQRHMDTHTCLTENEIIDYALTMPVDQVAFDVEAGWLNGGMWHGKNTSNWNPNAAKQYGASIAKWVGANHEAGRRIIAKLQAHGYTVNEHKPTSKKWDHAWFLKMLQAKRITHNAKRSNPEVRDALRCIIKHF